MKKHSISRRELLATAAAAGLAGIPAPGSALAAREPASRAPGIQLYTLRASMEDDVAKTLEAVAAIGYREVEFAGYFGRDPEDIRTLLGDLGLSAPSAHASIGDLRTAPDPLLDAAVTVGHRYVIVPWLPAEERRTLDDYRRLADDMNRIGEMARARDLRLAYHNHDFELVAIEGQLPLDLLRDRCDPRLVDFELDFYWVTHAGHDVLEILSQAPERFRLAHIKDRDAGGHMVDVGSGTIDFGAILASPAAAHLDHLFVEHDNPVDPFRTAAVGRLALSRILAGT